MITAFIHFCMLSYFIMLLWALRWVLLFVATIVISSPLVLAYTIGTGFYNTFLFFKGA